MVCNPVRGLFRVLFSDTPTTEIYTNNATVVIAYDGTLTSIFEIEAIVSKLKFKLEGVGYLS